MQDITEYLKDRKISEATDLGMGSMGSGTTFWDRSKSDYPVVAHVSDYGVVSFYKNQTIDSKAKKTIEAYAKGKKDKFDNANKLIKRVSALIKKGNNFDVIVKKEDGSDLEKRTVVIHNKRANYIIDGKQLNFSHKLSDVESLVGNGTYVLVESNIDESLNGSDGTLIVGQPLMFGQMECVVESINDTMVTLSVDGEVFETDLSSVQSVQVVEAAKLGKGYTHFAIIKSENKIADGWDYKGVDKEDIKDYTKGDLADNYPDNKYGDFKIVTRKALEKAMDVSDTNNWYKNK